LEEKDKLNFGKTIAISIIKPMVFCQKNGEKHLHKHAIVFPNCTILVLTCSFLPRKMLQAVLRGHIQELLWSHDQFAALILVMLLMAEDMDEIATTASFMASINLFQHYSPRYREVFVSSSSALLCIGH
jgi:hypothetical protein